MNQHLLEMFGTTFIKQDNLWDGQQSQFFLDQNWPNPVKEHTQFRFGLAHPCQVTLTLYNLAGQEIAILVDRYYVEGEHVLDWDSQDLPPGTYFYRLTAGAFTGTRKLVILR